MVMTTTEELTRLQTQRCKKYLNLDNKIDWEERRYEIAKEMLPVLHKEYLGTMKWQCEQAIKYADELIYQLKNTSK